MRDVLEALEERTMLSGTSASLATSQDDPRAAQCTDHHDTPIRRSPSAEAGQYVPLVATVKDAGTGDAVDAGKVEPMTGTVAFVTDSPDPVVLGEVKLNKTDKPSSRRTC